jgi:hypothetical protein
VTVRNGTAYRHLYLQWGIRWVMNYSFSCCCDMQVSCLMVLFVSDLTILQTGCWSIGRYVACDVKSYMASWSSESRACSRQGFVWNLTLQCWDTVARPVVIYSIVSQPEARIFYLALHNCVHESGSCSTTQEIPTPPPVSVPCSHEPSVGRNPELVSHLHILFRLDSN